jgi:cytochrome c
LSEIVSFQMGHHRVATIRCVRRLFPFSMRCVIVAVTFGAGPLLAQASGGSQKTVWDGRYSAAQARRGEQVFKTECAYCHKEDLSGGFFDDGLGRAPALAGKRAFDSSFVERWGGMTVADMVSTIAATMPQKRPASLSLENYIDVASYLLSKNDVPAGPSDLPADVEALQQIDIVARP